MATRKNDFSIIDKLIAEQPCNWFLQYNSNVLIAWKVLLLDHKVPYKTLGLDESYLAFPTSAGNLCINNDYRLLLDDYLLLPKYPISKNELLALAPIIYKKTSFLPMPFITSDVSYTEIEDNPYFFKKDYLLSKLTPSFEEFKVTLLKKQRYHVNFADKKYPGAVLESVKLTDELTAWGVAAVKARFDNEDWPYAAAYWLMGVAMLSSPNLKLYKLSQNNETLALAIVQHQPLDKFAIGYSFVFANLPDVGVLLVSKLVKFYCENMMREISYFNASVGTEIGNNPAFVYKKCVGNHPAQSLNLAIRRGDEIEVFPPLYDNEWIFV